MKRIIFISMAIIFCVPLFSINAIAETKAEKYLGDKEMCIDTIRIKETRVLDNQTILFEMRGGAFYINRLLIEVPGLKIAGGFTYSTSIAKLCKQDSVKVLEPGYGPSGAGILLGEFVQFKEEGTIDDLVKLLDDGLLEELVAEGAFKEAFPEEK